MMDRTKTTRGLVSLGMAAALVGLFAACLPLGRPSVNLSPPSPRVWDSADPAVLTVGNLTYLFGTTNNMRVPVRRITTFGQSLSDSKTHWARDARNAMPTAPAWVDPTEPAIWAPTVKKLGEEYVMWFAAARRPNSWSPVTDELNDKCIGWAKSASPTGPYVSPAKPVYCGLPAEGAVAGQPASNRWGRGALDPEVLRGADGRLYLLVAVSRTGANIGALRLDSIGRIIGGSNARPATLAAQHLPWHDGTVNSTLNRSAAFLENPSMIYDPTSRSYLLFYSAGQWNRSNYVTGFGRCETPVGPCTLQSNGPMLKQGNGRSGVGGLTAFTDTGGTMRVAFSSWQAGREGSPGPGGIYARQGSWATLILGGSDPETQTITIR